MLEDRHNKLLLSLIEEELKKLFQKDVLTNYPKMLKYLNSAKSLSVFRPLEQHEDLITHILEEQTVSIDDSIYQKAFDIGGNRKSTVSDTFSAESRRLTAICPPCLDSTSP